MSTMSFIPKLQEFLRQNKRIHTVKKYKMEEAIVEVEGVGSCLRKPFCPIDYFSLGKYVNSSGFNSTSTWANKINSFIPKGEPWYLYEVILEENKNE